MMNEQSDQSQTTEHQNQQQLQQEDGIKEEVLNESCSSDLNNVSLLALTGASVSSVTDEHNIEMQSPPRTSAGEAAGEAAVSKGDLENESIIDQSNANDVNVTNQEITRSTDMHSSIDKSIIDIPATNPIESSTTSQEQFKSPLPSTLNTNTSTKPSSSSSINRNDSNIHSSHADTLKTPDFDSLLSPPNVMRKINHSNSTIPTVPNTSSTSKSNHATNQHHKHKRCMDTNANECHHDGHAPYSPIRKLSPSSFLQSNPITAANLSQNLTDDGGHLDHHPATMMKNSKLTSIALHYRKEDRFQTNHDFNTTKNNTNNNDDHDEDDKDGTGSDTANSLISEYGSDIGEIRVRMEDIHAMDAVLEDEEEDDENNSRTTNQDLHSKEIENHPQLTLTSIDLSSDVSIERVYKHDSNDKHQVEDDMKDDANCSKDHDNYNHNDADDTNNDNDTNDDDNNGDDVHIFKPRSNSIPHHQIQNDANLTTPNTPIAAVSAAIRRLGTGVTNMARCSNNEEHESSTFEYVPQTPNISDIHLLKDNHNREGENNLKSNERNNRIWLSPRFGRDLDEIKSSLQPHSSQTYSSPSRSPSKKYQELQSQKTLPASFSPTRSPSSRKHLHKSNNTTTQLLTSPLRHLRGCFSFDPESGTLPYNGASNHSSPPSSPLRLSKKNYRPYGSVGENNTVNGPPGHRKSKSWSSSGGADVFTGLGLGHNHPTNATTTTATTNSRYHGKSMNIYNTDFDHVDNEVSQQPNPLSTPRGGKMRSNFMQFNANSFRSLTISSPKKKTKGYVLHPKQHHQQILISPQKVKDIEREDALDILSLLVERSVEFDKKSKMTHNTLVNEKESDKMKNDVEMDERKDESYSLDEVSNCLKYFRECSENNSSASDDNDDIDNGSLCHNERLKILDELEQSFIYANEMKRASLSAQTWLRSVGRPSSKGSSETNFKNIHVPTFFNDEFPSDKKALESITFFQQKLKEKDDVNARLNQELSTCRAEIGRLKSMKRNESQFTSPNKSILDDTNDDDSSSSSSTKEGDEEEFPNMSDIHLSINSEIIDKSSNSKRNVVLEETEVDVLKREIIKLKEQLQQKNVPVEVEQSSISEKSIDGNDTRQKVDKGDEEEDDKTMVNVRMLDAENFVTDWNTLGPLPPPPDHELRSPIVSELLNQWTTDKSTQGSLMSWIETVMKGEDPASVQPLQISSLNHEIRDGFVMHILPILLRRSDIHVELSSRAHRHTSYDIAVSIKKSIQHQDVVSNSNNVAGDILNTSLAQRSPHMMAFKLSGSYDWLESSRMSSVDASVTHSATTAPISNNLSGSHLNQLVQQDRPSSQDHDVKGKKTIAPQKETQPQSIVSGALSAMGGLLGRRKPQGNNNNNTKNEVKPINGSFGPSRPLNAPQLDGPSSSQEGKNEEDQPYHRVVSAPPGKIGITFVQYRGHAMISDVLQDSPLLGWVFPSDILIAIDEVPVSGMRVPEIVKLLTARKERQRALRLISSHAMTELLITQESGALIDG